MSDQPTTPPTMPRGSRRIVRSSRATSTPRSGRPRHARRALPAAGAPARAPLRTPRRALRRPLPGRVPGPGQRHRALRPRAPGRLLELRGADHPRRDQALLPRPHVVGPGPARPAGPRAEGRPRRSRTSTSSCSASPTVDEITKQVSAGPEEVLEALKASGAYQGRIAAGAPGAPMPTAARPLGDALGMDERGFAEAEDRATVARLDARDHAARARGPVAALRRRPHAGGDRRAGRRLADAGLVHHHARASPACAAYAAVHDEEGVFA